MNKENIYKAIVKILVSLLEVGQETITQDTSLIDTLVMDSIQLIEFILYIENEFHITIDPHSINVDMFMQISFLVDYLYDRLNSAGEKDAC